MEELKRFSELHVGFEARGSPRGFEEQGNIGQIKKGTSKHEPIFWLEQENKTLSKLEDENIVSKFIKRGTSEHGAILEGNWDPLRDSQSTTAIMPGKCSHHCVTRASGESHEYCGLCNAILIQGDLKAHFQP